MPFQDHLKLLTRDRREEQMNMIRHDDQVAEVISFVVVSENLCPHDVETFLGAEMTLAKPAIKAALDLPIEVLAEAELLRCRQPGEGFLPPSAFTVVSDRASFKPKSFLFLPSSTDRLRESNFPAGR